MNHPSRIIKCAALLAAAAVCLSAQGPPGRRANSGGAPAQLPEGAGKETVQRVCGATCHGPELIMSRGRQRDQWTQVVTAMVTRGAKATDEELVQIVDYLAKTFPPNATLPPAPAGRPAAAPGTGSGPARTVRILGSGPDDQHVVDPAAAERGKTVYIAECITCHGNRARGANDNVPANQRGSDLVRSLVVLHDRYGDTIGPFLKKGHPMQSGNPSAALKQPQIVDLSHFLHDKVNDTLRSGPYSRVQNVLTGDAKAGAAYFNGKGRCNTCHSPTGDLAGVGKIYDPPTLQGRFLFPRTIGFGRRGGGASSKPVMVTVTPASGPAISGTLVHLDDFNVALRDSSGEYHSWSRTPALKVDKKDPYAVHNELLDVYTDKDMHDIVAYLETLK